MAYKIQDIFEFMKHLSAVKTSGKISRVFSEDDRDTAAIAEFLKEHHYGCLQKSNPRLSRQSSRAYHTVAHQVWFKNSSASWDSVSSLWSRWTVSRMAGLCHFSKSNSKETKANNILKLKRLCYVVISAESFRTQRKRLYSAFTVTFSTFMPTRVTFQLFVASGSEKHVSSTFMIVNKENPEAKPKCNNCTL